MKFAGIAGLIAASTAIGFLLADNSKNRITICRELMSLCDLLSVDISFRASPVTALLCELLENGKLVHLGFISADNIKNRLDVSSPLSREENRELSEFLYSLGKTDSKSQVKLIESFKEYIRLAEHSYSEKHKKEAKLYLSFGFFSGALLSLLLV